jgi:hypothetical protein
MLLTLHNLAKTYKMLPSEALEKATTFDLYILDAYGRYVKYQEDVSQGKVPQVSKPRAMPTESEMLKMMEKAKNFVHPKDRKNDNIKKDVR